jgi:hypothetical protein
MESMLGDPRGRSTVTRTVMFGELRHRLDEDRGPGEVPLPDRRTLHRLANYLDRGRRNFVSEASRRTSVNRPARPFTAAVALRPGEDVPVDTNKWPCPRGNLTRLAKLRRAKSRTGACGRHTTEPGLPVQRG